MPRIQLRLTRIIALRVTHQRLQNLITRRVRPLLHHQRQIPRQHSRTSRRTTRIHRNVCRIIGRTKHLITRGKNVHVRISNIRNAGDLPIRTDLVVTDHTGKRIPEPRVAGHHIRATAIDKGIRLLVVRTARHDNHAMTQRIKHPIITIIAHSTDVRHVDDTRAPIDHGIDILIGILPDHPLAWVIRFKHVATPTSDEQNISLRHQTRYPLAPIPTLAIAHQPREHGRAVRRITTTLLGRDGRLQITIIQHTLGRSIILYIDERTDLILHLRVRQPRIIRNNLEVIHADLHTRTIQTSLMRRDNRTVLHRPQATHIIRIRGRRHTKGHGSSQYSRAYGHDPARHPPRFPQTCPAAHHRPFSHRTYEKHTAKRDTTTITYQTESFARNKKWSRR